MEENKKTFQLEAQQKQTELYKRILSCFRYGRANAIHLHELERLSGLDSRSLRKIIELMRRNGECICSDETGYYRPETLSELEKYIKRVEATAKSLFYTLKTARAEFKKMGGVEYEQMSFDEIGQGGE